VQAVAAGQRKSTGLGTPVLSSQIQTAERRRDDRMEAGLRRGFI